MIAEAYANLGNIHIKLENFNDARRGLVKSLQMSKSNKGDLKTVYSSLATLDSIQGNYKEAYKHYRLFIQYRDSLTNEENSRKSTQTRLQYEFDKKEAVAKEEQEKKDTEAKRVKNLQYFAIGGLCIVVVAVLFIFSLQWRHNKQKKKTNAFITKQKEKRQST